MLRRSSWSSHLNWMLQNHGIVSIPAKVETSLSSSESKMIRGVRRVYGFQTMMDPVSHQEYELWCRMMPHLSAWIAHWWSLLAIAAKSCNVHIFFSSRQGFVIDPHNVQAVWSSSLNTLGRIKSDGCMIGLYTTEVYVQSILRVYIYI